jgi:hypothetical protein
MEAVTRILRRRGLRWPRAAVLALSMAIGVSARVAAQSGELGEYPVKAAFLLNFTKFVEWPPRAFDNPTAPLNICILGDDPFGRILDQIVEGEIVNGRKLAVERIRRAPAPKACQVLFFAKSEKDVPAAIEAAGDGVLTVSDQEGFVREGSIISFVVQGRHVRFDINQRAASKAGLSLSSRLLNVARSVQK